ncbi:hypothetical protein [Streptomyces sp. NBC_00199]|uniref:hypothetical protein n=1 Tax=Streptomyces sp. NBC_00199 TaxID=2975678 RepID=UPI00224DDF8F|nr:hypothetical protein [Streptomyces sp. NBC_00199]MCX5267398.1 hypothetical protein [Streptomyces sp. NBC_00199]
MTALRTARRQVVRTALRMGDVPATALRATDVPATAVRETPVLVSGTRMTGTGAVDTRAMGTRIMGKGTVDTRVTGAVAPSGPRGTSARRPYGGVVAAADRHRDVVPAAREGVPA